MGGYLGGHSLLVGLNTELKLIKLLVIEAKMCIRENETSISFTSVPRPCDDFICSVQNLLHGAYEHSKFVLTRPTG